MSDSGRPTAGLKAGGSVRSVVLIGLVAVCFVTTRAQQATPPAPPVTFKSGVEIVTLDVSVLGDNRQPVRGLTAEDFAILEGGKPLPIVAFKAIDLPDRRSYPAGWMREIAPDVVFNNMDAERVIVLLLDDWNVSIAPMDVATTRSLGRSVIDQMGPADVAAVIYTFSHEKSQDFTNDRERLNAAVDRFKSSKMPEAAGPSVPSMMCPHNECVTSAFRSIAQVLQESFPGRRKAIAYVSPEGGYTIGPQPMGNAVDGLTVAGESASIWDSGPDLRRTFQALQTANVNVYQYDPRGIADSLSIIIAPNTSSVMGMFAQNTGGGIVTRTNAPTDRVGEMFIENSSYYMLGFLPAAGRNDGKLHPIDVRVSRPDVDVRTRSGYFAPTAEKPQKAPKKPPSVLDKAMEGTLPKGELPMGLTVAPFAIAGPLGGSVVVVAGLDRPASMSEKDVVEIAARAFDEASPARRTKGVATGKLQLTRRPTATGMVHYDVATRLDVVPGRYEIRLAMDSTATKLTGSAFMSVVVPAFTKDPLSLSGVVLGRLPVTRPTGKDPLNGLLPFIPTTTRIFARTDRIGAYVRIYQGGKDPQVPVAVRGRIIDQTDRTLVDNTTTVSPDIFQTTERTNEHRLELPLSQLEPGEYLLSIDASAGKTTQTRHVRFKVE